MSISKLDTYTVNSTGNRLKVTDLQGNTDQNHNEMLPHTRLADCYQKKKKKKKKEKKKKIASVGEDVEKLGTLVHFW